jgi:hypothetical protein
MTEFDQLSILFGFQINDVKELQEKVASMSSANGIKDNARKRFTTNILTNDLPFVR